MPLPRKDPDVTKEQIYVNAISRLFCWSMPTRADEAKAFKLNVYYYR